jgi:UDP-N-acetylglucosamine--dolichyl-phosphate N-acetylglucosaminephosphotransferase
MHAIIFSMLISFLVTFFVTPKMINFLSSAGVVSLDLHKKNKPKLPSSGGICVAFGVLSGLLSYIGIQTFVYNQQLNAIPLLAVISSVLIVAFVGFLDDINVKRKEVKTKDGTNVKVGLPQWLKPLITLPAAIPLMVISVGETTMAIPFFGEINFLIFYPLFLVPLGVVAASNLVNLLGGFNGSEAGMGIVYMLSLGIYGLIHGSVGAIIFLVSFASLIGFIKYNWFPAKILPGDSLTYLLGSLVASGVIVGNMERVGVIVLFPFIIEFFLKARAKFKASCLGKLRKDGKLDPPYGKNIYSITHVLMNLKKMEEKEVTIWLIIIAIIFSLIPFLGIL